MATRIDIDTFTLNMPSNRSRFLVSSNSIPPFLPSLSRSSSSSSISPFSPSISSDSTPTDPDPNSARTGPLAIKMSSTQRRKRVLRAHPSNSSTVVTLGKVDLNLLIRNSKLEQYPPTSNTSFTSVPASSEHALQITDNTVTASEGLGAPSSGHTSSNRSGATSQPSFLLHLNVPPPPKRPMPLYHPFDGRNIPSLPPPPRELVLDPNEGRRTSLRPRKPVAKLLASADDGISESAVSSTSRGDAKGATSPPSRRRMGGRKPVGTTIPRLTADAGDDGNGSGDAGDARPVKRMRRGDGTESVPKSPLSQEVLPDEPEQQPENQHQQEKQGGSSRPTRSG